MRAFAIWLLGLRAERPREWRRLMRIRRRVYRTVGELQAEIVRSDEPIPFTELDRGAFRPLRAGTAFGKKLDCAWIHITGDVPAGSTVLLGIRGEGLVYSADGIPVDSVSTVYIQGDLPHSGGKYRPLEHIDTSTGRVDIYADVAWNGILLYPYGSGIFHGARVAVKDDDAFDLFYDYLTLLVLENVTEDAALTSELRVALDASWARFSADDIPAARAALAASLAAPSTSSFVYSGIGHGHLDMAWLWPLRETHRKAARTYTRAVNTIDVTDDYLYGTSQPQQLFWMKQEQPELFARVKQAVADGRIELQGSFWIEPDTNIPNGESLVRQAIFGRRFYQEEFGLDAEDLRLCWLPDTFGYNGNLPQILKKSGMDWFQTIKLAWNKVNNFPHRTFNWSGIDGSTVLVHMPPEGDYNSRAAADGLLKGIRQYPEVALDTALLVYGMGDGGGGPGEVHQELLKREKNLRGLPRVELSTAGDFFRALEKRDIEYTHQGELYLETHQGTYTTQGAIKKYNRLLERKLHNAEVLAVITGRDSRAELEQHWRDVLLNQFHDILPGSSIERVNREAVATYERLDGALDEYIAGMLPAGTQAVANLTAFPRREHVKVGDAWFEAEVAPYAASALTPWRPFDELRERGSRPFDELRDRGNSADSPVPELVEGPTNTGDTMSNGVLTLRFDPSGEIGSCLDAAGTEQSADGLNRLVLHNDPYQFPFDAWDIKQDYYKTAPRTLRPHAVTTTTDGPLTIRTQLYKFGKSTIEQRIILEAGSDVVRFETTVDWHEKHKMLRAEFRPNHFGPVAKCEIQFGHIDRMTTQNDSVETAQFEVCAHKWIATEDATGGFSLLNDGKYGHRAKDGLISLNLLRSPTFPDKTADRGIHHFTYAFTPFAPGDLAKVVREGYRLNNPLLLTDAAPFDSIASTDAQGVVIETIKPAESGRGTIIRLYESLGVTTTTALTTSLKHSTATFTDLLEQPIGSANLNELTLSPFEITTIHLEP